MSLTSAKNINQGSMYKRPIISSFDSDYEDVYDWILDIDLITNINMTGWKVYFSEKFS